MRALLILVALANLGQAPVVKGGTIAGTVNAVVKGKPVKVDELYVFLEHSTKQTSALGAKVSAKIEQRDEKYWPFVTIVPVGAKVFFPNRDDKEHNVFSPAVKKNNWLGFDLGRYNTDKVGRHRKFMEPGEFDIYCDIHKCMWAKVKVVETTHFVKVVDGKYSLADIPPGTYRVVAWAPNTLEVKSRPFEVTADGKVSVDSLNLQYTSRSISHMRKDGTEYTAYDSDACR